MAGTRERELRQLARLHGVQTSYVDVGGKRKAATPETLVAILRALGSPIESLAEVSSALRERRHVLRTRPVERVVVVWDDRPSEIVLRVPACRSAARLSCVLTPEAGEPRRWTVGAGDLETAGLVRSEGGRSISLRLPLPCRLPPGYHRLAVRGAGDEEVETLVIAAPARACTGMEGSDRRLWGLFCPPYALHRSTSWGAGDFSDLDALMAWIEQQGGNLVATLPMLASFLDDAPTVSPYSPASRLFWNEFYLDLARVPELAGCEAARTLISADDFRGSIAALRRDDAVHYGRQMTLKRRVLEVLAEWFFAHPSERTAAFQWFLSEHPEVEDYATFMAAGERHGRRWLDWPANLRGPGRGRGGDVDERVRRYHQYVQWLADEQLRDLSEAAVRRGLTWYVDFPIGVDLNSYDVWSRSEIFALGASVGCPPDLVFTRGQDWGFPPLHPERQREQHYRYLIAAIRHHLRYAGALRIDHVMGLHRLYWIAEGTDATTGAFVSYPAEEIYGILSVESHRRGAWLVGEDLGTVPPEVGQAMDQRGVHGMYVVQYELQPDPDRPLRTIPRSTVASVNTHDMPPFAAYWNGSDIADRLDLGLLNSVTADAEEDARADQRRALIDFLQHSELLEDDREDAEAVLHACWAYLAASPAHVVLLNIEDLWLETAPQNTPNTFLERPNWRRKLRYTLEQLSREPRILAGLRRVAKTRRGLAAGRARV